MDTVEQREATMEGRIRSCIRRTAAWLLPVALLAFAPAVAARFLSADPVPAEASTGAAFARHAYAEGNPYRHVDPDGRQSVAWVVAHEHVPPAGQAHRLWEPRLRGTIDGAQAFASVFFWPYPGASSPAMLVRGVQSEARVLALLGELKNTRPVVTPLGRTIPDFENAKHVGEIKDARRVTMSPQLRMQIEHARNSGRTHVLVTGTRTRVSRTVEAATVVVRRDDLGPPP